MKRNDFFVEQMSTAAENTEQSEGILRSFSVAELLIEIIAKFRQHSATYVRCDGSSSGGRDRRSKGIDPLILRIREGVFLANVSSVEDDLWIFEVEEACPPGIASNNYGRSCACSNCLYP